MVNSIAIARLYFMTFKTLIFLHGYGVRGNWFWEPIKTFFESKFAQIYTPDLQMDDISTLIDSTKTFIYDIANKYDTKIYVIGHSLGGVVGTLACQDLGVKVIDKFAAIAVPFGDQNIPFKSLVRFLVRYRMIPGFISRPRFFSKHTPKEIQKVLWKKIVQENQAIQNLVLGADKWFHTDLIKQHLTQESIVFASEADKVVPWHGTKLFSERIGANLVLFPRNRNIKHNDFIASPMISQEIAEKIIDFFLFNKK